MQKCEFPVTLVNFDTNLAERGDLIRGSDDYGVRECVHVHMCISIYTYVHIYIYIYIHIYTYICALNILRSYA